MIKKRSRALLLFFLVLAFVAIGIAGATADAADLVGGSTGSLVKEVQRRLKDWGYYKGEVDGKYGQMTIDAVKKFQKRHGLSQTGTVNEKTAEKLGVSLSGWKPSSSASSGKTGTSSDLYLMARCIYGEARGEPYMGKVAIGAVILNRVKSKDFPNTIAGVIYQPKAFSVVADGQINLTPDQECINAARDAMNGVDPTGGCVFYYNPAKTSNKFMHSLPTVITIGSHRFAKGA
ncbi:MAG: spore cortex-lytic enzyme [Christensenellales bacterium]|jgi:N-acetylmuramoyl-L-alanine amidase